ncbi:MAG TPA: hypothetical protein VFO76_07975 [Candidatus Kapabacteria bacterium]|nr:hypothetical protein [Candidatus Kapabacteria bacterium]
MKYIILFFAYICLLIVFNSCKSCSDKESYDNPTSFKDSVLQTFRELLARGDSSLGFKSLKEIDAADVKLENGINIFYADKEAIIKYNPAKNPELLLLNTHQIVYPIYINGKAVSSVIFEASPTGWKPVSFGDKELIEIEAKLAAALQVSLVPPNKIILIDIPALMQRVFAERSNGELLITSPNTLEQHQNQKTPFLYSRRVPAASFFTGAGNYLKARDTMLHHQDSIIHH